MTKRETIGLIVYGALSAGATLFAALAKAYPDKPGLAKTANALAVFAMDTQKLVNLLGGKS